MENQNAKTLVVETVGKLSNKQEQRVISKD